MKRKLAVTDLTCGMYVCELDRPWLESQCLFQGFYIDTEAQLQELKSGCLRECKYVVIDTLKGADLAPHNVKPQPSAPSVVKAPRISEPSGEHIYPRSIDVEQELAAAQQSRSRARSYIDQVFEDITAGETPDLEQARAVVNDLVESIMRNPDAQMCFTQLKNRDEYTAQHSVNVCVLALAFGRHLGLAPDDLNLLGTGALLHDIGKLKTPLEVLNKPGRLTDAEFEIMRQHPVHGRELLERIPGIPPEVIDVAFSHHERLQGHGYPRGLQHDEISVWSRMVAIVDVYDAITSDRCYHEGMAPTEALTRMYEWRIRDFDPDLLEQFVQCIGIYPIGSLVELSTGEVGVVISMNPKLRLRPKVSLVLDADKNPYFPARVLDLAGLVDHERTCTIKRVLDSGTFNVDVQRELRQLKRA